MSEISKIDKNFAVKSKIEKEDIQFFSVDDAPFKLCGVFKENGKYRRMPEDVAKGVSEGVYFCHTDTAGGRVRFVTDSPYVAIHVQLGRVGKMPHFALSGSGGLDLYVEDEYIKTFVPPYDIEDGYESIIEFETKEERQITIHLPLYAAVNELYIGLQENSLLKEAKPYQNSNPIVYYGSSITQGGCASRPGMSYPSIVSRRFHYDFINLGFSGSAKAEDEMIAYIKNLTMSLFVFDYDHNAPTVEYLANTHEKMFQAIRKENPNLPIIIMSRPRFHLNPEEEQRLQVIETTYNNAVLAGDENVYLINGKMLTALSGDEGTVDSCHPTDFGFASMANALGDVIEHIDCI